MSLRFTWLAACCVLGSLAARAKDLKLDDLVAEALRRNPEILAAQKRYEAARQRPSQAASLPDPLFSPAWNSNGNPLPGAGLGRESTSNIGFTVTQEVPAAGKRRTRADIARKDAEAQFEEYQLAQLGLISRVKQAFFRLQHYYAAREVLERNRQLLRNLVTLSEIRYSAGKAAQADVFKAQVQLSLIEPQISQLERERRLREAEINSLLAQPSNTPIGRPGEPHLLPLSKTLAELQAAARDNSPQRLREQKATEKAELSVNLARKEYSPDYALTGGYFNMGGLPAFYTFRADIKIPLYFKSKQRAALTEQTQMLSQARHTYEAAGASLDFRIADDYSLMETSQELMDLYSKTILPQARLAADSALASYETGALDFLSALSNYTVTLDYEMNYHEQMLTYHLALARLEETTGIQLIEGGH